jgi:hypothetical protein
MGNDKEKYRETPIELAQRIRSTPPGLRAALFSQRRSTTRTYERMGGATVFLPGMETALRDALAPEHVCRWIAWGKLMPNRILRMGLALYARRPLSAPTAAGRSLSGMAWLLDIQKSTAEAIFLEQQRGKAVLEWIRANMYKDEFQEESAFSSRFWAELRNRVAAVIPLDAFWEEIDRRVNNKPRRKSPKHFKARPTRPGPLPKEFRDALRIIAKYEADQYGVKK